MQPLKLQYRIQLLAQLGEYLSQPNHQLSAAKEKAFVQNPWFVPEFIDDAIANIALNYLQQDKLINWAEKYKIQQEQAFPVNVGLTMAGNIPLVGFHDWLCIFVAGHHQLIKPSSKDEILIKHLVEKMVEWEPAVASCMQFAERLTGCEAYIATGSNNSSRYFEYYFGKYPSIIRRNRTSVAVLKGNETSKELDLLAGDILQYFGLGCRNVSKLYVPEDYSFEPLLSALSKYPWMQDHNKFRNNYEYNLSLHILNNKYYMTNGTVLLIESTELFSPIAQVNYEVISKSDLSQLPDKHAENLQCICGTDQLPFGLAQSPQLADYADGIDTMDFLCGLRNNSNE